MAHQVEPPSMAFVVYFVMLSQLIHVVHLEASFLLLYLNAQLTFEQNNKGSASASLIGVFCQVLESLYARLAALIAASSPITLRTDGSTSEA